MKTKPLFFLVLPLILMLAFCKDSQPDMQDQATFSFQNLSGHDLQISAYRLGEIVIQESIPNDKAWEIIKYYEGSNYPQPFEADSVYLLFKNPDKFKTYLNQPYRSYNSTMGPANQFEQNQTKSGQWKLSFKYWFTTEDYKNATPL